VACRAFTCTPDYRRAWRLSGALFRGRLQKRGPKSIRGVRRALRALWSKSNNNAAPPRGRIAKLGLSKPGGYFVMGGRCTRRKACSTNAFACILAAKARPKCFSGDFRIWDFRIFGLKNKLLRRPFVKIRKSPYPQIISRSACAAWLKQNERRFPLCFAPTAQ